MWDVVPAADWELRVRSIERQSAPRRWSASGGVSRATEQIALIVVDLTNRSAEARRPRALDFALRAVSGQQFVNRSAAIDARAMAITNGLLPFGAPILPGERATTVLVFDLDPRATRLTLTFRPAPRRTIRLDECHCSLPLPAERGLTDSLST